MRALYISLLAIFILTACGQKTEESASAVPSAKSTVSDSTAIPTGQLDDTVTPHHYRLALTLLPEQDSFTGTTEIDVTVGKPVRSMFLHGNGLIVDNVTLTTTEGDSHNGHYQQVDELGVARIDFDTEIPAGAAVLSIHYSAPFNKSKQGLYKSTVNDLSYAFTQFEPISARRVFPGFDEPRFKVPFDITVTAHEQHTVVTNTPVIDSQATGEGLKRIQFATTKPLPTYLLAFAVGELDVVEWDAMPTSSVRNYPIPLRGIATKGEGGRLNYILESTAAIVIYLEEYFGTEYPYAKLDLIASPGHSGAMENAGAIIYASSMILLDDNASADQRRRVGAVHAHELAHHWFGDLVTPKWWDDIWLNESFASWMGNKAAHAWNPEFQLDVSTLIQSLAIMNLDARISARQIRNPVDSNSQISNAFDGITYLKGGGVLSMFESYLGEEGFQKGIQLHMQRFPHKVADVEDFMSSLADGSGRLDVVSAFRSFIDQPGLPIVGVEMTCENNVASLALNQSRYLPLGSKGDTKQTWEIPLCVSYRLDGEVKRQCNIVSEAKSTMTLEAQGCPDYVMPNANGAGYYRFALDDDGWTALMASFAQLPEREALALVDSLSAAYQVDRVSTATLIKAYRMIAGSPYRAVAMAPSSKLKQIRDNLAEGNTAEEVEAFMRSIYKPRLAEVGLEVRANETVDTALLRDALVKFLAMEAMDTDLRKILAEQASNYIGMDKKPNAQGKVALNRDAVAPAFTAVAMSVAVQELGESFAKTLFERMLVSDDSRFREQAAEALGNANDPELAKWVRSQAFDERFETREATNLIFGLAKTSTERRATFEWFKANSQAFTELVPIFAHRWLPSIGSGFCSMAERDELESVFTPIVKRLPTTARGLSESLEKIELCAALADAKRAEVTAYFK